MSTYKQAVKQLMDDRNIHDPDGTIEKQALEHVETWRHKIDIIFANYERTRCSVCHLLNNEHSTNCINHK